MRSDRKERKEREKTGSSNGLKTLIIAAAALVLIYGAGFCYSYFRFLPRTYMEDASKRVTVNLSNRSASQANKTLLSGGPEVVVIQKNSNGGEPVVESIKLDSNIGASMSFDTKSLIQSQEHALWFTELFSDKYLDKPEAVSSYDETLLSQAINKLYCMQKGNNIEPSNAYIKEDIKDGESEYTVIPSREGSKIKRDEAINAITSAVDRSLKGEGNETVDLTPYYEMPTVYETDENLIKTASHLKEIMSKTVTLYPNSWAVEVISGEDMRSLLSLDQDGFSVDEDALRSYVSTISDWYSISRFQYIPEDELYNSLETALLEARDTEVVAEWVNETPLPKGQSNSPSIIEVSIGEQYLWYYEYGELKLSTPVVTGNPDAGKKATFLGTNYVHNKANDIRLKSDDKDDPYDVKVKYWIGIDSTGYYGIHDADWRGAFGGDIYTYNPSHGCVNVPPDIAAQLFSMVEVGTTDVYIYW